MKRLFSSHTSDKGSQREYAKNNKSKTNKQEQTKQNNQPNKSRTLNSK